MFVDGCCFWSPGEVRRTTAAVGARQTRHRARQTARAAHPVLRRQNRLSGWCRLLKIEFTLEDREASIGVVKNAQDL